MSIEIVKRSVVYEKLGWNPGLTSTAKGDLLSSLIWYPDAIPGSKAFILRSSDGEVWSGPETIITSRWKGGSIHVPVGITSLKNGTVLLPFCDIVGYHYPFGPYHSDSYPLTRRGDFYVIRSDDDGYTWQNWQPILENQLEFHSYGKLIELKSGKLLCPVWKQNNIHESHLSAVYKSCDEGRTWETPSTMFYKKAPEGSWGFNETSIIELPDGRVLAVGRNDLPVEDETPTEYTYAGRSDRTDKHACYFYRSISEDEGETWSEPERTNIWGQSPSLHLTQSGRLILGYRNFPNSLTGQKGYGVAVSWSEDEGLTWQGQLLLEDPKGYKYKSTHEAGYPAFENLKDGKIVVLFYSHDESLEPDIPYPGLSAYMFQKYIAQNVLEEM